MDKRNFIKQIERLISVYGEECYPLEVINVLYSELGHVRPEKFSKVISRVIGDHPNPRFAPGLSKIENELAKMVDEDQLRRHEGREVLQGVDGKKASESIGNILRATFGGKGA